MYMTVANLAQNYNDKPIGYYCVTVINLYEFFFSELSSVMGDYDRIHRMCQKRGELWEDPDFPATQSSVFYHQKPPFQFVWKRPKVGKIFSS